MIKAIRVWLAKRELDNSYRAMVKTRGTGRIDSVLRYSKACRLYHFEKYGERF